MTGLNRGFWTLKLSKKSTIRHGYLATATCYRCFAASLLLLCFCPPCCFGLVRGPVGLLTDFLPVTDPAPAATARGAGWCMCVCLAAARVRCYGLYLDFQPLTWTAYVCVNVEVDKGWLYCFGYVLCD